MEEIDEWQQIEQHSPPSSGEWNRVININNEIDQSSLIHGSSLSLQMVPTPTAMDPEEDGTSSPLTASSSASNEECETQTPAVVPLDWANQGKKLLKQWFGAIVIRVASMVRNCAIRVGAFWSITYVAGATAATAVLVSLVCVGVRRRRRKVDHLEYLLRQKDEKISQLLLQIANLNEALSSRRKVPVHQIYK